MEGSCQRSREKVGSQVSLEREGEEKRGLDGRRISEMFDRMMTLRTLGAD